MTILNNYAGGSVGLVVLVIAITCTYLIRERRKLHRIKQMYFRQHGGLLLFEEMKSQQGVAFKIFSEEELQQVHNSLIVLTQSAVNVEIFEKQNKEFLHICLNDLWWSHIYQGIAPELVQSHKRNFNI